MSDIREVKVEINTKTDIGAAICREQAGVGEGESVRLVFLDGGTWIGGVVLTRADGDALDFTVEGVIFNGVCDDRGIKLSFRCEPDGPVGMPIVRRDCCGAIIGVYTDDGNHDAPLKGADLGAIHAGSLNDEDSSTKRAAFYAAGTGFTAENAPKPKLASNLGYAGQSRLSGQALKAAATKAQAAWMVEFGRAKGHNTDAKWLQHGKIILAMMPGEIDGIMAMPKPVRSAESKPRKSVRKRTPKSATGVGCDGINT